MFNRDVPTGKKPLVGGINTDVWDIFQTCTPAQAQMLRSGVAIPKDFIMTGYYASDGAAIYY